MEALELSRGCPWDSLRINWGGGDPNKWVYPDKIAIQCAGAIERKDKIA